MNRQIEIKIYDTWDNLPACRWKETIVDFEKEFAVKQYAIFAYVENEIVGFMRVLRNPDDVCEWYTCDVHVGDSCRRKGIATLMYKKTIEIVAEYERATKIITSISASNVASIKLHKKIGFIDTGITSSFADYTFEKDETKYCYWLEAKLFPARNVPIHMERLFPMWKAYMIEIGEKYTDEDLRNGLINRLNISQSHENIFFELMWCGNDMVGFVFYAVDGGIRDVIPSECGYIMELFITPQWRRQKIGVRCIRKVVEKLKKKGCPKIYLTSVETSEEFWEKSGFIKSDLIDPDDKKSIYIKEIDYGITNILFKLEV